MPDVTIAHDAKRAFHNHRGLGNYSRDTIRIIGTYLPQYHQILCNPKLKGSINFSAAEKCSIISPESWLYKAVPALWRSFGCVKDLKASGVQLYHGLAQELPTGIEKSGIRTVLTVHDAIFLRNPELYPKDYVYIFTRKNKRSCAVADSIIAISEQTKADFINYFNVPEERISVIYQGCNNRFRENIAPETVESVRIKYKLPKDFILNVGAVEERKNVMLAVEAIQRGHIDIPIVIIGSHTKYADRIGDFAARNGMQNKVILIHNVDSADLPAIYTRAQAFVYPSIFEGFGIPILEALCTGTPVITSTGSCFSETGGPSSIYVHPDNIDEMADALNKVLTDTALREKMIADGKVFADNFTDDKIALNLDNLYRSIL